MAKCLFHAIAAIRFRYAECPFRAIRRPPLPLNASSTLGHTLHQISFFLMIRLTRDPDGSFNEIVRHTLYRRKTILLLFSSK